MLKRTQQRVTTCLGCCEVYTQGQWISSTRTTRALGSEYPAQHLVLYLGSCDSYVVHVQCVCVCVCLGIGIQPIHGNPMCILVTLVDITTQQSPYQQLLSLLTVVWRNRPIRSAIRSSELIKIQFRVPQQHLPYHYKMSTSQLWQKIQHGPPGKSLNCCRFHGYYQLHKVHDKKCSVQYSFY